MRIFEFFHANRESVTAEQLARDIDAEKLLVGEWFFFQVLRLRFPAPLIKTEIWVMNSGKMC